MRLCEVLKLITLTPERFSLKACPLGLPADSKLPVFRRACIYSCVTCRPIILSTNSTFPASHFAKQTSHQCGCFFRHSPVHGSLLMLDSASPLRVSTLCVDSRWAFWEPRPTVIYWTLGGQCWIRTWKPHQTLISLHSRCRLRFGNLQKDKTFPDLKVVFPNITPHRAMIPFLACLKWDVSPLTFWLIAFPCSWLWFLFQPNQSEDECVLLCFEFQNCSHFPKGKCKPRTPQQGVFLIQQEPQGAISCEKKQKKNRVKPPPLWGWLVSLLPIFQIHTCWNRTEVTSARLP